MSTKGRKDTVSKKTKLYALETKVTKKLEAS